MLNVIYGNKDICVYNPNMYFNNTYQEEWFNNETVREMVRDVDKSEVKSEYVINSPVLGQIPPEKLSGGVKTLILMLMDDSNIYNATACGDNCAKWILRIAEQKDLTIALFHNMNFGENFTLCIKNTNQIVHNMPELIPISHQFL